MKRTLNTLLILLIVSPVSVLAQQMNTNTQIDKSTLLFTLNALAILLSLWIVSSFILTLVRLFLTHRLRNKLIEKNASQEVIEEILPKRNYAPELALKWCCLFAATGIGLTICYFTQPLGLHSAIILSFCLAAGLLAYFLISKSQNQKG